MSPAWYQSWDDGVCINPKIKNSSLYRTIRWRNSSPEDLGVPVVLPADFVVNDSIFKPIYTSNKTYNVLIQDVKPGTRVLVKSERSEDTTSSLFYQGTL